MEALSAAEELEGLSATAVLRCSLAVPRAAPRNFSLIAVLLVFPLSFAVLAHTLFTHPLVARLAASSSAASSPRLWTLLFLYQLLYLLFLLAFSLLSTAAVVFSVASLLSSPEPLSFPSVLRAVPPVFSRLLRTFLLVAALVAAYHLLLGISLLLLLPLRPHPLLLLLLLLPFLALHVYISALWHLASVVTVLEPLAGLAALRRSRLLLRGRASMAARFVLAYLLACGLVSVTFRRLVVDEPPSLVLPARVAVGGLLVATLVAINFAGLLLQSVFYYVCRSVHHQPIDVAALHDHLGGYLGEYVPLKSSVQLQDL